MSKLLLSIVEQGGYPDLTPHYKEAGFEVVKAHAMRKVVSLLKKITPDVIVAEFNFQSDFRDRTSSLETLLATMQTRCPYASAVILYEKHNRVHLDKLLSQYTVHETLPFPIDVDMLKSAISSAVSNNNED